MSQGCTRKTILKVILYRILDPLSFLELKIHLFQHSTGNAHPLAEKHSIILCRELVVNFEDTISMAMEVFGENLVLTVDVPRNFKRMYVYNWKTGVEKCVSDLI